MCRDSSSIWGHSLEALLIVAVWMFGFLLFLGVLRVLAEACGLVYMVVRLLG